MQPPRSGPAAAAAGAAAGLGRFSRRCSRNRRRSEALDADAPGARCRLHHLPVEGVGALLGKLHQQPAGLVVVDQLEGLASSQCVEGLEGELVALRLALAGGQELWCRRFPAEAPEGEATEIGWDASAVSILPESGDE